MTNNTEFYDRILNGTYTSEDVEKFEVLCSYYSDMYKDIYGVRPRDERTMCVNAYSGTPNIEEFRNLLKEGFNPLADLDKEYDELEDAFDEYLDIEGEIMYSSKEEILSSHPECKPPIV